MMQSVNMYLWTTNSTGGANYTSMACEVLGNIFCLCMKYIAWVLTVCMQACKTLYLCVSLYISSANAFNIQVLSFSVVLTVAVCQGQACMHTYLHRVGLIRLHRVV